MDIYDFEFWISITTSNYTVDIHNRIIDIHNIPNLFMNIRDRVFDIHNWLEGLGTFTFPW